MIPIWWLLAPIFPCLILGMIISTSRWKGFTADMIRFQVEAALKRPDSWTEQLALQRLKALTLTISDDPKFVERAGFPNEMQRHT